MSLEQYLGIYSAIIGTIAIVFTMNESARRKSNTLYEQKKKIVKKTSTRKVKVILLSSYLFQREIFVILTSGIVLNSLGLILSVQIKSILYLDMIGTAFVSYLMGPWWGAITGLLSNSIVNYFLYTGSNADLIIFRWSMVNICGGIIWGYLAKSISFNNFITSRNTTSANIKFLIKHGVLPALVMSLIGSLIQTTISDSKILSLDEEVANAIDILLIRGKEFLLQFIQDNFSIIINRKFIVYIIDWFQNWIRYIPDKTISAAIAIFIIKYCYPLFEKELIINDVEPKGKYRLKCYWFEPIIFLILYVPISIIVIFSYNLNSTYSWIFWILPSIFAISIAIYSYFFGVKRNKVIQELRLRLRRYTVVFRPYEKSDKFKFFNLLIACSLFVSFYVLFFLPLLAIDYFKVALNFLFIINGILLSLFLIRHIIIQNEIISNNKQ